MFSSSRGGRRGKGEEKRKQKKKKKKKGHKRDPLSLEAGKRVKEGGAVSPPQVPGGGKERGGRG